MLRKTQASCTGEQTHRPYSLVIDQFEEFLILHKDEERTAFIAFLTDLTKRPIENVRLLIVFRSDYRPLIFKLDLPPLVVDENWKELAAYDRGEAQAFLRASGRELAPEAADSLFRGLDRIDDAAGMYRLITLNMVGLVLERMGNRISGDPGRLIQSYLASCLQNSEARDYARTLLVQMTTDAGTKEPRKETDLVDFSGFKDWQVKATLAELARLGLVRQLSEQDWEIAHDFLARMLSQRIGSSLWQRAQPLIAPIVLMGWIGFVVLAWPYIADVRERSAEAAVREIGGSFSGSKSGGVAIDFLELHQLAQAIRSLRIIDPDELRVGCGSRLGDVRHADAQDWEALGQLNGLRSLVITCPPDKLEPLRGLIKLQKLSLANADGITSLEPLKDLANLRTLNLSNAKGITSLEPLKNLTDLQELSLTNAEGIDSLEPLRSLTSLQRLVLDGGSAMAVTSLEPVKGLANLQALVLNDSPIASLGTAQRPHQPEKRSASPALRTLRAWSRSRSSKACKHL